MENKLYKSPTIAKLETSKHKYGIFNEGEIKATLTLAKIVTNLMKKFILLWK